MWTVTATSDDPADPSGPLGARVVVENPTSAWTRYLGVSEFRPRGARDEWVGVPTYVSERAEEMLEDERDDLENRIRWILNRHDERGKVLYDKIKGSAVGPCPRCGSRSVTVDSCIKRGKGNSVVDGPPYSIACCDCGLRTSYHVDRSLMLAEWNEGHPWFEYRPGRPVPIRGDYERCGA